MSNELSKRVTTVIVSSESYGALLDLRRTEDGRWEGVEYVRGEEDGEYDTDEWIFGSFDDVIERVHLHLGMGANRVDLVGSTARDGAAILSSGFVKGRTQYEGISINGEWCEIQDGVLRWCGDIE